MSAESSHPLRDSLATTAVSRDPHRWSPKRKAILVGWTIGLLTIAVVGLKIYRILFFGGTAWLCFGLYAFRRENVQPPERWSNSASLLASIVFLLALSASVVVAHDSGGRPSQYFAAVFAMAGAVVALGLTERKGAGLLAGAVLVLAVPLTLSMTYPGLLGSDIYYHLQYLAPTGRLPLNQMGIYGEYPAFYAYFDIIQLVGAVPLKSALVAGLPLPFAGVALLLYRAAERRGGSSLGLTAYLFAGLFPFTILYLTFAAPFSLAIPLIVVIFSFLNSPTVALLAFVSLMFVHPLALVISIVALVAAFAGFLLLGQGRRRESGISFGLLATLVIARFAFAFTKTSTLYLIVPGVRSLLSAVASIRDALTSAYVSSGMGHRGIDAFFGEALLSIPMGVCAGLGITETLRTMRRKDARIVSQFGLPGVVVTTIAAGGSILALGFLLPQRWFVFSGILIGPVIASAFLARRSATSLVLVALLVTTFVASPVSNTDSPLWSEWPTVRLTSTDPELRGEEFLAEHVPSTRSILSDESYVSLRSLSNNLTFFGLDSLPRSEVLVVRAAALSAHVYLQGFVHQGGSVIGDLPTAERDEVLGRNQRGDVVYENGGVLICDSAVFPGVGHQTQEENRTR
ncbi:MAG: hypothetical protein ACYDCK_00930 [Thermoplasmatota archaeon]